MTQALTRRAALVSFGAFGAAGLGGCNTTQTAVQSPAATSSVRISAIEVNTDPLLAQSGNPTANWVQQTLPGQLAQALAPVMAPGDPTGATLRVRINSIYLGQGGPADPDLMKGAATLLNHVKLETGIPILNFTGFSRRAAPRRCTRAWSSLGTEQPLLNQPRLGMGAIDSLRRCREAAGYDDVPVAFGLRTSCSCARNGFVGSLGTRRTARSIALFRQAMSRTLASKLR